MSTMDRAHARPALVDLKRLHDAVQVANVDDDHDALRRHSSAWWGGGLVLASATAVLLRGVAVWNATTFVVLLLTYILLTAICVVWTVRRPLQWLTLVGLGVFQAALLALMMRGGPIDAAVFFAVVIVAGEGVYAAASSTAASFASAAFAGAGLVWGIDLLHAVDLLGAGLGAAFAFFHLVASRLADDALVHRHDVGDVLGATLARTTEAARLLLRTSLRTLGL